MSQVLQQLMKLPEGYRELALKCGREENPYCSSIYHALGHLYWSSNGGSGFWCETYDHFSCRMSRPSQINDNPLPPLPT